MNRIRELREKARMKQNALAQAAGISAPYLHDLENGNRTGTFSTMDRIAEALGVSADYLRGVTEDEKAGAADAV